MILRMLSTLLAFVLAFVVVMTVSLILSGVLDGYHPWGFDFSWLAPPYLITSIGLALVMALFAGWKVWRRQR